jgi:hypothetical protein
MLWKYIVGSDIDTSKGDGGAESEIPKILCSANGEYNIKTGECIPG